MWQQVPSTQYSGRSYQCYSLDGLGLSSHFSIFFTNPLRTIPSAPITIDITVTFMFHSFFSSLEQSKNLSLFAFYLIFTQRFSGNCYYFTLLRVFHTSVFHWSLSDSMSPHISRTLLSIVVDLKNSVVWIVFTRPFISESSSPLTNFLVTVPSASFTIGFTVLLSWIKILISFRKLR